MITTIICHTAIAASLAGFSYGVLGIAISALKVTKDNIKKSLAE